MKREVQRTFIPGSEWLYIKIYTGSNTADKILTNIISLIISKLEHKKQIEKWFFIRYMDPEFHLRIRLLLKDTSLNGEVLLLFSKELRKMIINHLVWKIQLDTYNRELERYGEHLIEQTESIFCIDSTYTLKILKTLLEMNNESDMRWLFSIKMIDSLLDNFGYNLTEKQLLLDRIDSSFKLEFGYNQYNAKQLNAMYRQYLTEINKVIDKMEESHDLSIILIKRSKCIQKLAYDIKKLDKNNKINTLVASYIHMMMNRLFCSKGRTYELLVYNFLNRFYLSKIAQLKY